MLKIIYSLTVTLFIYSLYIYYFFIENAHINDNLRWWYHYLFFRICARFSNKKMNKPRVRMRAGIIYKTSTSSLWTL